ncbi:chaperone protein DNAj [Diplonema papillatum]|nr:chaperone protein DNAj [Diplonema papillatum]KAJ9444589.1 chaperone protein DNAj [Diplonema papillatum]
MLRVRTVAGRLHAVYRVRQQLSHAGRVQTRFAGKWEQWREQVRQGAADNQAANAWVKENGSPYAVLGLKEDATSDDVKAAYRRLSMTSHPDKGGSLEEFQRIQMAHNIIVKGLYQNEDKMGFESIRQSQLLVFGGVIALGLVLALYAFIYVPLRWCSRKLGFSTPAVEPAAQLTLREEVRRLQTSVDSLQDTLEDVKEQIRAARK